MRQQTHANASRLAEDDAINELFAKHCLQMIRDAVSGWTDGLGESESSFRHARTRKDGARLARIAPQCRDACCESALESPEAR